MTKLTLALAQLNPTVGDISGNIADLRGARAHAAAQGADIIITTEMYLSAYPPEDLVLKPTFQESLSTAIERLAQETADGGPAILLGVPWREGGNIYNAMILLDGGRIVGKTLKVDLPNYGPFDEKRVFIAASLQAPLNFRNLKLGVMICEDMWTSLAASHLKALGADVLIVPNGSPYELGKTTRRHDLAVQRVKETGLPLIYLNQLGGQDELVFDGGSFVLSNKGEYIAALPAWQEDNLIVELKNGDITCAKKYQNQTTDTSSDMYHALMLGLRDYVNKNSFPGVVLGLSGGIDSALVMAIAVDALGSDKVWGVMLPSPYTSKDSIKNAKATAKKLGCKLDTIPITKAIKVFATTLSPVLGETIQGIVPENIQSRCRGLILMALSNAKGHMVLSTGNKSEMSVGYSTLYGDMCGGFAVLKDVYKTQVYKIARWRNEHRPKTSLGPEGVVIPDHVLTRAPSAELHPNQTDQDSLPPYDTLDGILECLIEQDMGMRDIVNKGFDTATVARVWSMLDRAEYKRRQAPPGVKITRRNLSRDRRYPITNKYKERATTR
jgi:NAD+ synthase